MVRSLLLESTAVAVASLACGIAQADTINSYLGVDAISGIVVVPLVSSSNLSYTVTLNPDPYFTYGGTNYAITDVWGFDALAFGFNDLNQPALPTIGNWSDDSEHKPDGSTLGWKATNPNFGLQSGESFTFTFPTIDLTHYTQFGFHVRLASGTFPGTAGNTGRIYLLPSPAAAGLFGIAGLAAGRRRRR